MAKCNVHSAGRNMSRDKDGPGKGAKNKKGEKPRFTVANPPGMNVDQTYFSAADLLRVTESLASTESGELDNPMAGSGDAGSVAGGTSVWDQGAPRRADGTRPTGMTFASAPMAQTTTSAGTRTESVSGATRRQRLLVALGGNALMRRGDDGTIQTMRKRCEEAADKLVELITDKGFQIILTHGNGPQVGALFLANQLAAGLGEVPAWTLYSAVAESEGILGYLIQRSMSDSLRFHNLKGQAKRVVSIVTEMEVDPDDPSFQNPSKPIGKFLGEEEVEEMRAKGECPPLLEDKARSGWRVVVPSPLPKRVLEADAVRELADHGFIVIAGGGGGIPVVKKVEKDDEGKEFKRFEAVDAVIDKDKSSVLLAEAVDADAMVLLTDIDCLYRNFGKPNQEAVRNLTPIQARELLKDPDFGKGTMRPKLEAAIEWVQQFRKPCYIGDLQNAKGVLSRDSGTYIGPGDTAPIP
eukprot:Clim_evm7s182 gene=Clim_evmTU7s182